MKNAKQKNNGFNELLSMIENRIKRGTNTTHKDWFEIQCKRLNLNFDETNQKLRSSGKIKKLSKGRSWPVHLVRG